MNGFKNIHEMSSKGYFTSSNETESAKSMKRLSVEMLLCYCTGENNHKTSLMDHDTVNNVAISLLFKY